MNKLLLSAVLAGIITTGAAAANAEGEREKCYGVAKAGKNDCAAKDGSHSCAGQASKDNDLNEWKFVAKGECAKQGGTLAK